jgi:hypothetical protein
MLSASLAPLGGCIVAPPWSQPLFLSSCSFTESSLEQVQCSIPHHIVSVRLQFAVYAAQFCWGRDSICPESVLDYVPRGWVGELGVVHVVCDAHLFILQILASSFGICWWGEMVYCFSQCSTASGDFSQVKGPGCHRVQFWLMLYLLLVERILCSPNVLVGYYFGWKQSELPKCSSYVSRCFLESQSLGFLIPYTNFHLGFPKIQNSKFEWSLGHKV